MDFLIITLIVGGFVWFVTRWFLKKEAAIIAADDAAWKLAKRDLQVYREEIVNTIQKKAEETVAVVEQKTTEVKQVAKATKRKAKK